MITTRTIGVLYIWASGLSVGLAEAHITLHTAHWFGYFLLVQAGALLLLGLRKIKQ